MVGTGVCLMETTQSLEAGEHDFMQKLFERVGIVHPTPTYLMQAGGALNGVNEPAAVVDFVVIIPACPSLEQQILDDRGEHLAGETVGNPGLKRRPLIEQLFHWTVPPEE